MNKKAIPMSTDEETCLELARQWDREDVSCPVHRKGYATKNKPRRKIKWQPLKNRRS